MKNWHWSRWELKLAAIAFLAFIPWSLTTSSGFMPGEATHNTNIVRIADYLLTLAIAVRMASNGPALKGSASAALFSSLLTFSAIYGWFHSTQNEYQAFFRVGLPLDYVAPAFFYCTVSVLFCVRYQKRKAAIVGVILVPFFIFADAMVYTITGIMRIE